MADPIPEKKSSFGCLKILAIVAGIFAILLIIFGILVWQTISWFKNAAEPTIATYAPLNLSEGEKEDVDRIIMKVSTAQANKAIVDEYVTPEVFNGVMEKIIAEDKKKNKSKANDTVVFRGGFHDNDYEVKFSSSVKEAGSTTPQYVNIDLFFDCEMDEGRFTKLDVKQVIMHDRPVPFFARLYLSTVTKALEQTGKAPPAASGTQQNPFEDLKVIKLLKREGNKIHVILDGAKMKPPAPAATHSSKKPAPTTEDANAEEKTDEPMTEEPKAEDEEEPAVKAEKPVKKKLKPKNE